MHVSCTVRDYFLLSARSIFCHVLFCPLLCILFCFRLRIVQTVQGYSPRCDLLTSRPGRLFSDEMRKCCCANRVSRAFHGSGASTPEKSCCPCDSFFLLRATKQAEVVLSVRVVTLPSWRC